MIPSVVVIAATQSRKALVFLIAGVLGYAVVKAQKSRKNTLAKIGNHHRRPVTREEVIVSLADACEAAVRALLNPDQRDRQVLQQTLRTAQAERLENPAASFEQVEARCLKELQRNEEQVIHRIQERVRSIFQSRIAEGQLDMAQVTTAELYNYEMTVDGMEHKWIIHSTLHEPVGTMIGMDIAPFDIHIMKKSEE